MVPQNNPLSFSPFSPSPLIALSLVFVFSGEATAFLHFPRLSFAQTLYFSSSLSLLFSLDLFLFLSSSKRPSNDLDCRQLNDVHVPGEPGQTASSWLGSTQLVVKCCRWRQRPRMRESRPHSVAPPCFGLFHHCFWVLTGLSRPPRQNGTLYSRRKCSDCRHTFFCKKYKLCK